MRKSYNFTYFRTESNKNKYFTLIIVCHISYFIRYKNRAINCNQDDFANFGFDFVYFLFLSEKSSNFAAKIR